MDTPPINVPTDGPFGSPTQGDRVALLQQALSNATEERDDLRARLRQVDDELVVNWITVHDGNYRQALRELVLFNIQIHDNPEVSDVAKARADELEALKEQLRQAIEARDRLAVTVLQRGHPADYRCPVCNGMGLVSVPPGVAGDQETFVSYTPGPWLCQSCKGTGVIWITTTK